MSRYVAIPRSLRVPQRLHDYSRPRARTFTEFRFVAGLTKLPWFPFPSRPTSSLYQQGFGRMRLVVSSAGGSRASPTRGTRLQRRIMLQDWSSFAQRNFAEIRGWRPGAAGKLLSVTHPVFLFHTDIIGTSSSSVTPSCDSAGNQHLSRPLL